MHFLNENFWFVVIQKLCYHGNVTSWLLLSLYCNAFVKFVSQKTCQVTRFLQFWMQTQNTALYSNTVCIFFSPTKLWSGTCGTSLSIVAATNRLKNSKRALGISTRQFVRSARKRTLQNKNKVVSKWEKHMLLKLNIYTCINVQCTCNGNKPNLNLSLSQASLSP